MAIQVSATPSAEILDRFIAEMQDDTRLRLPDLNTQLDVGERTDVVGLVDAARVWTDPLSEIVATYGTRMTVTQARQPIQSSSFWLSSIERNVRPIGWEPGAGLALLPGLESSLMKLARIGKHLPLQQYDLFWLQNPPQSALRFTLNPQEAFFHKAVLGVHGGFTEACLALQPIVDGDVPIDSRRAVEGLAVVEAKAQAVWEIYHSFTQTPPGASQANMTPRYFAAYFRVFLRDVPFDGASVSGPNAAHIPSAPGLDFLVGTVEDFYVEYIDKIWPYLTPEDQATLTANIRRPPLVQVLVEALGLTPDEVKARAGADLATVVAQSPEQLRETLRAFKRAVLKLSQASGMHAHLIQKYLDQVEPQLSERERRRLSVKLNLGTGKANREETMRIRDMRRFHEIVKPLIDAIR